MANDSTLSAKPERIDVHGHPIAYHRVGKGPTVVLVHGWPFHAWTYRDLLPHLVDHFECILVDLPGAGETGWNVHMDLSPKGLARSLWGFIEALALDGPALLAYDTGATVTRLVAAQHPQAIRALVISNTEIPGHRPPLVPLFAILFGLPGAQTAFGGLLRSRRFVRSKLGFGGCFHDRSKIDDEFIRLFVDPLLADPHRLEGYMRYARAIDWDTVDELEQTHAEIEAPVLLIWGGRDHFFPLVDAQAMAPQLRTLSEMHVIQDARLLVHEEHPARYAELAVPFLRDALTR